MSSATLIITFSAVAVVVVTAVFGVLIHLLGPRGEAATETEI